MVRRQARFASVQDRDHTYKFLFPKADVFPCLFAHATCLIHLKSRNMPSISLGISWVGVQSLGAIEGGKSVIPGLSGT